MAQPAFQRDDYTDFCDGVRRLTGIDLAQYKRPQMERRIRSFADRRGIAGLPEYLRALVLGEVDPGEAAHALAEVRVVVALEGRLGHQAASAAIAACSSCSGRTLSARPASATARGIP